MKLTLFNSLTKKKELFKPLKEEEVSLYTCGPTVYYYVHIGNLRAYLSWDLLKRTLLLNNLTVTHIMNVTDVGHLTSDADEGEDKMLKGAKREKKTVWEIAEYYTQAFKSDIKKLNILSPSVWCKATEHIKEQIDMIRQLEKKGYTYTAGGNVYFDTSKYKDYLDLFGIKRDNDAQARVETDTNKKNPHDFVLWFTQSKFDDQAMKWDSPWGTGYPGWHIECSAMATKYLGTHFDIHCGGADHKEVHHPNELAQTECATGEQPWVNVWMHNAFLVLPKGEKMSKSKDNFLTLSKLEEQGFDALDYRYLCLGTHYRKQLMYSNEALQAAKQARKKLNEKVLDYQSVPDTQLDEKTQEEYKEKFLASLNDDLNTPQALAIMWDVIKNDELLPAEKLALLYHFDEVLGLGLKGLQVADIPQEIIDLAEKRQQARANKDWATSDKLRDEIAAKGYVVGDTSDGYELKRA